jgi:hypothetical protein
LIAVAGTLGGVGLTQRYNERHRSRERAAATTAKVEELARALFESVTAPHLALSTHLPQHNSWRPRLMTLGSAVLEYTAAKSSAGHPLGMAQVGRIVLAAQQREVLAAEGLRVPLERVVAGAARAALLPGGDVREAALRLVQGAAESAQAYGQDNLWHPKSATAAREKADAELNAALDELTTAETLSPPSSGASAGPFLRTTKIIDLCCRRLAGRRCGTQLPPWLRGAVGSACRRSEIARE